MDRKEFGNLILENERQLYRIAKSILRSDEDCADVAQEAVMKAFEKLYTLRDDRYAKTWLIRILINECFRMADKQKRERMLADKVKSCEKQAHKEQAPGNVREEEYSELYQALAQLPREFRIILELYYLEEFSVKEISELMGIPEGTVKSRLGRGREKLKQRLCRKEGK